MITVASRLVSLLLCRPLSFGPFVSALRFGRLLRHSALKLLDALLLGNAASDARSGPSLRLLSELLGSFASCTLCFSLVKRKLLELTLALLFFCRRERWKLLVDERVPRPTLSRRAGAAAPGAHARNGRGVAMACAGASAVLVASGDCNGSSPVATIENGDVLAGGRECMHCAHLGSFSTSFRLHL